ncbi:hypothetical protein MKW92_017763 [Papaver armeniacum]|nr:hypothetical protein MKW92_017763 [Papaver armeniacum]
MTFSSFLNTCVCLPYLMIGVAQQTVPLNIGPPEPWREKSNDTGEAPFYMSTGADIEATMPKLLHWEYYTEPRIQELASKERAEPWFCRRVKDFVYRCRDLRSQSRVC